MNVEKGETERGGRAGEREAESRSLGGKEVRRMERKSTRASVVSVSVTTYKRENERERTPSTSILPFAFIHSLLCCMSLTFFLFFLRLRNRKGREERRREAFTNTGDGGVDGGTIAENSLPGRRRSQR